MKNILLVLVVLSLFVLSVGCTTATPAPSVQEPAVVEEPEKRAEGARLPSDP
jgi:uncharacterized protein YcfL